MKVTQCMYPCIHQGMKVKVTPPWHRPIEVNHGVDRLTNQGFNHCFHWGNASAARDKNQGPVWRQTFSSALSIGSAQAECLLLLKALKKIPGLAILFKK